MHIHIMVGKLVNVKAVSWLINMHAATSPLYSFEKKKGVLAYGEIKFNMQLEVVGWLVNSLVIFR